MERVEGCNGSDTAVEIKDGEFSWDDVDGNAALRVEEMEIKKGDHAAVVGAVGSGKSSLLASVLGEMFKISGKVCSSSGLLIYICCFFIYFVGIQVGVSRFYNNSRIQLNQSELDPLTYVSCFVHRITAS